MSDRASSSPHTIITNNPDAQVEHQPRGRYVRPLLERLGEYHLEYWDIIDDEAHSNALMSRITDPTLSFAYVDDTTAVLLFLKSYPGWGAFATAMGLEMDTSAKGAKRYKLLTRAVALWAMPDVSEFKMTEITESDFTLDTDDVNPKYLDGANVISRELMELMIANHAVEDPYRRARLNHMIDDCGSFSLRVQTPLGQVKGDAICVPRDAMGGYDLFYHGANLKGEMRTPFVYATAEPYAHNRDGLVWTDDQSLSWLHEWLYPTEQLRQWLADANAMVLEKLSHGELPKSLLSEVYNAVDEDDLLTQMRWAAIKWSMSGMGMDESVFMFRTLGRAWRNQLEPANGRRRYPIACCVYPHVATDAWLAAAGYFYAETPQGYVWLHQDSGRLVFNNKDFADLYERHGGWDLDDSVKAHYRTMGDNKVVVIVRSPNSFGEFSVMNFLDYEPGTTIEAYYPTWLSGGEETSFPAISTKRPAVLEEMDISYIGLPNAGGKTKTGGAYSLEVFLSDVQTAKGAATGGYGSWANRQMAFYSTTGTWRKRQLAPGEDIIDASTAKQTPENWKAIADDTKVTLAEIVATRLPVDEEMWRRRLSQTPLPVKLVRGWYSCLLDYHHLGVQRYWTKIEAHAQRIVENIDPRIHLLGRRMAGAGATFVSEYRRYMAGNVGAGYSQAFFGLVHDTLLAELMRLRESDQDDVLLAAASHVYTNPNTQGVYNDAVLFQRSAPRPGEVSWSIFDVYLRGLRRYGIAHEVHFVNGETVIEPFCGVTIKCAKCSFSYFTEDCMMIQRYWANRKHCKKCLS